MMKPEQAKLAAEEFLCKQDLRRRIEKHFYIRLKEKGGVRLLEQLTPAQLKLLALYLWCKKNGKPVRIIILKARKEGISTLIEILMLIEAMDLKIEGIVLAHDKRTAAHIFRISKLAFDKYDLSKPVVSGSRIREMVFGEDGHDGYLVVETANNVQAGTGVTPQFIHASEPPKWAKGSETATALLQSTGDGPETSVFLEGTAYGEEELFKPIWEEAEEHCKVSWTLTSDGMEPTIEVNRPFEWNGYIPLFISWMEEPSYKREFDTIDDKKRFEGILDKEEHLLLKRGTTLEQLNWRRFTIKNKCQNRLEIFKQEYPSTPQEAFITSGRPKLNVAILDRMVAENGVVGRLEPQSEWQTGKLKFIKDVNELFTVFHYPEINHNYIIGCDVAEGIQPEGAKDPDESVFIVFDLTAGCRQAATFAGRVSETMLVEPLARTGIWYNHAFINVDNSSTGKHVAIKLAEIYRKDRLYWGQPGSGVPGFRTHVGNRHLLVSTLSQFVEDEAITLTDRRTISQCKSLVTSAHGKVQAAPGKHDDHPAAIWFALIAIPKYPRSRIEPNPQIDFFPSPLQRRVERDRVSGY